MQRKSAQSRDSKSEEPGSRSAASPPGTTTSSSPEQLTASPADSPLPVPTRSPNRTPSSPESEAGPSTSKGMLLSEDSSDQQQVTKEKVSPAACHSNPVTPDPLSTFPVLSHAPIPGPIRRMSSELDVRTGGTHSRSSDRCFSFPNSICSICEDIVIAAPSQLACCSCEQENVLRCEETAIRR